MIEWLKKLYDRIRYLVRLDGRFAPAFRSLLGILTGDPGSPQLWNLFMSDFILAWHPEDIQLNGVPITDIEHADDILAASGTSSGLQSHLNYAQRWSPCNNNECETSIPKCLYQVFGPKQKITPTFNLGGKIISQVSKACYLGVLLETGVKFIWREQYKVKADKATTVANVLLGLDRFVGSIPAWDARSLYMARVDPYLTAGCDVCLDVEAKSLALLERIQLEFLCRMLGVGRRSLKVVLFSETGIWPIKYRRVYLALKYLCYLLQVDQNRRAWNALQESISLARKQKLSWINDLRIVLSRLHVPVFLEIAMDLDIKTVEAAMKSVEKSMEAWIDDEIASSSRVKDLLAGRLEMDSETRKLVKKTLDFRHYLRLASPAHRVALTKMVLSSHSLAIERRRWTERGKKIVPQQWRLCRFCFAYIEDPAHAMFVCQNPELLPIRKTFLDNVSVLLPGVVDQYTNALQIFKGLLARREVTPLLGKLAYDVLKIFEASPMLCVHEPTPVA
ncbi:hypothetical protein B0H19DRAFT_952897 [Mycena capillaripes]|nr:hypothetical protein B0H19DRAFT_952897 [Mycena capillaripes]